MPARRPTIPYTLTRRFAVAVTAPQPPAAPLAVSDKPTFGETWAFRAFLILFFLTLIIGLLHFLFSKIKYST